MLDSVTINTIPFVQAVSGGSINLDTLPLNLSFDPNVEHYICEQLTNVSEYCNCDVQDTNFGTETVYHGTTSTFWETDNVECGKTCKSETRTCTNGVISGTGYTVPNSVGCTVGSCLYGENHTPEDCTGSGGAVETLSDNAKICNFPGYCRFGWSQYLNYSITTAKTCEKWDGKYCEFWSNGQPGTCNQCNSMTMSGAAYPAPEKVNCTTGSHATMSNIARETCSVVYHQCGITSPPGCPITSCGLKEQTEVCKADITAIACY
ncbi:hypothetical protein ISR94_04010 [Candidatus Microgenomates bacterium]|nr:hypothetical protein [Candidatus Microgenomates bacterium]